jgi:hypothetical protein
VSPRRIAVVMAVLVALLIVLASASSRRPMTTTTTTEALPPAPPPARATVVQGDLPAEQTVKATVGDVVEVKVQSGTNDVAQVDQLGVTAPVGPGISAPLQFVPSQAGSFPVTLRWAEKQIGTIVVRARS